MPDASSLTLAKYRLERAEKCLSAAITLQNDGFFADSANRSYYAIFHAVRALLALDGVDFKKHSGVISYFQQNYIKTSIFRRELSDYVRDAFAIRQNCDYEDFFVVSKADVSEQISNARVILDAITVYLGKQTELPSS